MTQYHVTLGGQGLMLDLQSYKRSLATLFAGKIHDGSLSLADLVVEAGLALSDWSGGEGQLEALVVNRYASGAGVDGFTTPGALQVGPDLKSDYASTRNGFRTAIAYKGLLYVGVADGKVDKLTLPAAWANAYDTAKAGGITCLGLQGGFLYNGNNTDNICGKWDGTTFTAAGFTATGLTTVQSMALFDATTPRLYCAGPGAAVGEIHAWNGATFSVALYTVQEPSCGPMVVLPGSSPVLWVAGVDSTARRARLYRFNGTNWDLGPEIPDNYPTSAVAWNGALYWGMNSGGELWSWDGSTLRQVARGLDAAGDPLRGLFVWRGALWVTTRNGTDIRLKRYDGTSWSEPIVNAGGLVANSAGSVRGGIAFNGNAYVFGEKAGAAPVCKADPAVFPTAARSLVTSNYALESAALAKLFRSVTITHAPLVAGQSVQVEYQLDNSGSWVNLGSNSTVASAGTTFGFSGTVTGKQIAFRLTLVATSGATPTLSELKLTYLPPIGSSDSAAKRQWDFEALFEGTAELPLITLDQTPSGQTGAQISSAIWSLFTAAGRPPVTFTDLDGVSRTVYLVDLEEKVGKESQRKGYQTRGKLRLVEA
jgi:hypothetical protein